MASTYPTTIDVLTDPSGTQTLSAGNHAGMHATVHDALEKIEAVMGTTSGTAVLKNITNGKYAVSDTNGTLTTPTLAGGTISNAVLSGTVTANSGTLNGVTLGTPVIGTIAVSGTTTPLNIGAGLAPTVGSVVDSAGGTLTVNAQAGQVFTSVWGTAAGNRTIGTPTNPTNGQSLTFALKTSGSVNGTVLWASAFRFPGTVASSIYGSTKWNYYSFRYNSIDSVWDYQGEMNNL